MVVGSCQRCGEHPASAAHPTSGWEIDGERAAQGLTRPSQEDCSYAGLAWGLEEESAMSYHSQHEPPPADVFLARFRRR